jgi:endonuclease III
VLRRRAHHATIILHTTYGSPRHGNKDDPLDELVFIILSQMTTQKSFNRVFDRIKEAVGTWDAVLQMRLRKVKSLIKDAGLSNQKAPRLKTILWKIKSDYGRVDLDALRGMVDDEVEDYLTSLPGVGRKTAKCIMMYSLGREVLPVDTHVWRVGRRLGLVGEDISYNNVHEALEAVVVPADRYRFHVNAIAHGRTLCVHTRPHCSRCPLNRICLYPRSGGPHR